MDVPPVHFAPSTGARIAYQMFGEGNETVVSIPPLAQNIEVAWEWPHVRAMLERFGSFARFIVFDKRGTGSSDRTSVMPGIDERVDDLRAVLDHAGVDRAHLMGVSEGGPMTILFAATYPHRVSSLILHGTGARLIPDEILAEIDTIGPERRYRMADNWGTPESQVAKTFAPSLAADPEYLRWFQRYERLAASRDSMRDLIDLMVDMDVTDVLPTLDVPTLVQHRTGDRAVPVVLGRRLADAIPGAELIEYPGDDHFTYAGDMESMVADLERWVTGSVAERPPATGPSAPTTPTIVTLGRFAVEVDGREVPTSEWGSRLSRQLCKRLVTARGWPVTRDELIDQLWPDETDLGKLGSRLSVHLSAVRRVLGGAVVADRQTVRLDLDAVRVDLESFLRLTDDRAIVEQYAEFLPEDRYDDWTEATRTEVRSTFLEAAMRLIDGANGDVERVVTVARRVIAVDRFADRAHRAQVAALLTAGRVSEARAAHQQWSSAMAELDIEVEPLSELMAEHS